MAQSKEDMFSLFWPHGLQFITKKCLFIHFKINQRIFLYSMLVGYLSTIFLIQCKLFFEDVLKASLKIILMLFNGVVLGEDSDGLWDSNTCISLTWQYSSIFKGNVVGTAGVHPFLRKSTRTTQNSRLTSWKYF